MHGAGEGRWGRKDRALTFIKQLVCRVLAIIALLPVLFTRGKCGQVTETEVKSRSELWFGRLRSP